MKHSIPVEIVFPKSLVIKNYIAYYYFLQEDSETAHFDFWHYPHHQTSLVFFKGAAMAEVHNRRIITSVEEDNLICLFNNNLMSAKREVIYGKHNIIGVVFHPLGAKYFRNINTKHALAFYERDLMEVFNMADKASRISKLDEVFEKSYQEFHSPILKQAVKIIIERSGSIYLSELSTLLKTSRRTILRNFRLHLSCSFQDFKSVVKFRKALEHYPERSQQHKLSDLAYDLNYYDQSAFIKSFKSLTQETPKKMLDALEPLPGKLVWKLKSFE